MIQSSCECGAVRISVAVAPTDLTDCNCTICRRYAALWAYYSPRQVQISGLTDVYLRGEKKIEFHRCRTCGCVTHWSPADKTWDRMGVNCRMMDPTALSGIPVRKLDGFDTWRFLGE